MNGTRLMPDRGGALRQVAEPAVGTTPHAIAPGDWPAWAYRLKPQLAFMASGSGGRYVADDIDAALWSGRMRAWVAERDGEVACLLVTETIEYPRFKALRLVGFVGGLEADWLPHCPWLEEQAREMGCSRLEALHLPKLGRALAAWSPEWRVFHTLSEKRLCDT